jgi:hypothetical protein
MAPNQRLFKNLPESSGRGFSASTRVSAMRLRSRSGSRAAIPGNVDLRSSQDRHLLIVDKDRNHLYELYTEV